MRNMKKILFAIVTIAVLFTGCSEKHPVKGFVVGKQYNPAHTDCTYNVVLKMPQSMYYPAEWVVFIADSIRVHRCLVDYHTFNAMKRGDYVELNKKGNGKD